MYDAMSGMACFVIASVSFIYGTRIAWVCGKECSFSEKIDDKKHTIKEKLPPAIIVYLFGFLVVFSLFIDGVLTIGVSSLTSSILFSVFVVSMAMPELKFRQKK